MVKRISENLWTKDRIMSVSYASLVTDNVDQNARLSLPYLNPYSLQELCRFKIRQSIRTAIEEQDENYFKIKRELSTYNLDRSSKKLETQSSSSDNENSENEEEENEENGMQSFNSIFIPSLRTINSIDNELRLMLYNQLTDQNGPFGFDLGRDEEGHQRRALVLLRPEQLISEQRTEESGGNEEQESSGDSGVSEGSQSSSLTEQCKVTEENADLNNNNQNTKRTRNDSVAERQENLLRTRIMQLPLSIDVKKFLLYYRDI